MNLLKLRKRLKFALRGHKLLKDKQEQLSIEFNNLIIKLQSVRESLEKELKHIYLYISEIIKYKPQQFFDKYLAEIHKIVPFEIVEKDAVKFNIRYKEYEVRIYKKEKFMTITTDPYFNFVVNKLVEIYKLIIDICNMETLCELLAKELQSTRRRVNALEYILIPQIQQAIKFIVNRLNEFERTNIIQLMRIKQIMQ